MFDFDQIAKALGVERTTLPANGTPVPPLADTRSPRVSVEPLTDLEWAAVHAAMPPLPVPRPGGFRDREFIDAVLWHRAAKDRGLGWVTLPSHFPPRMTVQHRWHRWAISGTWVDIARKLEIDDRISAERCRSFQRIATDAARKRERVLTSRARLNE